MVYTSESLLSGIFTFNFIIDSTWNLSQAMGSVFVRPSSAVSRLFGKGVYNNNNFPQITERELRSDMAPPLTAERCNTGLPRTLDDVDPPLPAERHNTGLPRTLDDVDPPLPAERRNTGLPRTLDDVDPPLTAERRNTELPRTLDDVDPPLTAERRNTGLPRTLDDVDPPLTAERRNTGLPRTLDDVDPPLTAKRRNTGLPRLMERGRRKMDPPQAVEEEHGTDMDPSLQAPKSLPQASDGKNDTSLSHRCECLLCQMSQVNAAKMKNLLKLWKKLASRQKNSLNVKNF